MALIDVDEFVKSMCNKCDGACDKVDCDCLGCHDDCRCDFIKAIEELRMYAPKTERSGEWIPLDTPRHKEIAVRCSACNNYAWRGHRSDFCPNCGADMRR